MKQRTYKATGINLKGMPMGESDRLVTVLTKEYGLVRAIAPGARKHKSSLGGRSGLFVVNDLLFTQGKSIDKLIQAETLQSFPGLSRNLAKLTASQYLAEIVLAQALSEQPQADLYYLLIEHLSRIEAADQTNLLACLAQATFHLLALAGVAPEVFRCCLTRQPLTIELGNPDWRVGFSVSAGGAIAPQEMERLQAERIKAVEPRFNERSQSSEMDTRPLVADTAATDTAATDTAATNTAATNRPAAPSKALPAGLQTKLAKAVDQENGVVIYLSAAELALMQQLSKPELVLTSASSLSSQFDPQSGTIKAGTPKLDTPKRGALTVPSFSSELTQSGPHLMWRHIEKALRQYTQYQFDRPIRSAALIDTCFTPPTHASRA
ncbi:MAG: DNA repair protein RecO [Phormidesmis sp.]